MLKYRSVLAALTLLLSVLIATPIGATSTPTVIVYGDSMESQAYPYVWFDIQQMTSPPKLIEHAWPGVAICDWFARMQSDAATVHPIAVMLTFVGNDSTPCVKSAAALGPAALAVQYGQDLTTAITTFMNNGTKFVYVYAGPTEPTNFEKYASGVRRSEMAAVVAYNSPRVKWINAAKSVDSPVSNQFTLTRECVPYEINRKLCKGAVINHVRTNNVRISDGHFCTWPWPQGTFCPGAWRYGNAQVTALMNGFKWGPLPPTNNAGLQ